MARADCGAPADGKGWEPPAHAVRRGGGKSGGGRGHGLFAVRAVHSVPHSSPTACLTVRTLRRCPAGTRPARAAAAGARDPRAGPLPRCGPPLTGSAGESQGFSPAPQARSAGPGLTGPCRCPSRAAWIARRGRAQEGGLARDSVCSRGSVFPWAFRGNPVLVDCRAPGRVVAAAFGPPDSSPLLTLLRAS